jgi:peroxiredoxin
VGLFGAGVLAACVWGCGKKEGSPAAASGLVGQSFPYTRFITGDGEVIDLASAPGRERSLVVFMRGFPGYVCTYCTRQTAELVRRLDDIRATNAELFIVYPGPADAIPRFLDAVRRFMKTAPTARIPVPILLDVDLKAVEAVGIKHKLSYPSTFLLDAQGTVRYAYIGKGPTDRPAIDDVLSAIRAGAPQQGHAQQ